MRLRAWGLPGLAGWQWFSRGLDLAHRDWACHLLVVVTYQVEYRANEAVAM